MPVQPTQWRCRACWQLWQGDDPRCPFCPGTGNLFLGPDLTADPPRTAPPPPTAILAPPAPPPAPEPPPIPLSQGLPLPAVPGPALFLLGGFLLGALPAVAFYLGQASGERRPPQGFNPPRDLPLKQGKAVREFAQRRELEKAAERARARADELRREKEAADRDKAKVEKELKQQQAEYKRQRDINEKKRRAQEAEIARSKEKLARAEARAKEAARKEKEAKLAAAKAQQAAAAQAALPPGPYFKLRIRPDNGLPDVVPLATLSYRGHIPFTVDNRKETDVLVALRGGVKGQWGDNIYVRSMSRRTVYLCGGKMDVYLRFNDRPRQLYRAASIELTTETTLHISPGPDLFDTLERIR